MKSVSPIAMLLGIFLLLNSPSFSQAKSGKTVGVIDHIALHVHDLKKSAEFYEKVVGIQRIPDPFKDDRHVFFGLGPGVQLHLIAGGSEPLERDIDVHFALRIASFSEFLRRLDDMKVNRFSAKKELKAVTNRPDGVKQIYFQDPDGYWIEVNDVRP